VFTELMPLLKQRVLVLTISRVDDENICVSVIPKKRENVADENVALTIPLALTGKPEELDRDLPAQLSGFADSVIKTGSNLEQLKAEHAAAVKAVDAENRKRLDEKKKINGKTVPPAEKPPSGPEFKDGKPVFGSRPSPEVERTPGLFDGVEKTSRAPEEIASASPSASTS
jgi:PRTRC genetic system protein E